MSKCIGSDDNVRSPEDADFLAKDANISQTVPIAQSRGVLKRPRGRPKLSKSSEGLSETLSDTSYNRTKSRVSRECGKRDGETSLTTESNGDNDITNLSESLTNTSADPTSKGTKEMAANDKSNLKRGRGRPPGALNKKNRHSLDAYESNTSLTTEGNGDNDITNLSESLTTTSADPTTKDAREMAAIDNSNLKRGRGRPPGALKKKNRHSLDAYESNKEKENAKANLSQESNQSSQIKRRASMPAASVQRSTINRRILKPIKRSRGRPPGSKNKPKLLKPRSIDVTNGTLINYSETVSDLRKTNKLKIGKMRPIQSSDIRKIPKHRFDEAVEIVKDSNHSFWQDMHISCSKSIYRYWEERLLWVCDHNIRLKFARQFLMRRDWKNLCKVLNISLRDGLTGCNAYFTLFAKYAALNLAHTDKQQFNKFIKFLLKTEDVDKVLKKCSQFSQNCTDEEEIDE